MRTRGRVGVKNPEISADVLNGSPLTDFSEDITYQLIILILFLTRCAELESCSRSVLAVDDGSCTAAAVILLCQCITASIRM